LFSERYGYNPIKEILFESVSSNIRNRVWNLFYHEEIAPENLINHVIARHEVEAKPVENYLLDRLGLAVDSTIRGLEAQKKLESFLTKECEWYQVYDFIEHYLLYLEGRERSERADYFNMILEGEKAGYRVVNLHVVPITNQGEIREISRAMETPYSSPNMHIEKALNFYADRQKPDYENSIKESISAVEAMCCIITGLSGPKSTLNEAIKKLKDKGVHIHPAMERAFIALYGYTSDEHGIRHGGIDFKNVPAEDAKYMLVSCSAFVNYLIEKWNQPSR